MTSSSSNPQKALKKRLAALARKTNNRVCCDCPEKAPTWAAIIPPHEHAPLGSRDLVAFICFNCAGAHRQLGPLVSQVKSIALDEWEEYDLESAERSGNKRVNQIYEATLKEQNTGNGIMIKPLAGAHEASRQRFVRDKYAERTYYSKGIHFKHVALDQSKAAPSTPSKSLSNRRNSLMVFLKNKDDDGDKVAAAAFGKEASVGTHSTRSSGVEGGGGSDGRKALHLSATTKLEQAAREAASALLTSSPGTFGKRRHSVGPLSSGGGRTSIAPPNLEGSFVSKPSQTTTKGSRENSQRSRRTDTTPTDSPGTFGKRRHSVGPLSSGGGRTSSAPPNLEGSFVSKPSPTTTKSSRENSQRSRRTDTTPTGSPSKKSSKKKTSKEKDKHESFDNSEGSMAINDAEFDGEEINGPYIIIDTSAPTPPETPRTNKPKLMTIPTMPSPANSRVSLYSSKSGKVRGRSSSRRGERTIPAEDGEKEPRSSSRSHRDSSSKREKSRGRSTGAHQRDKKDLEKGLKSPSSTKSEKDEKRSSSKSHRKRTSQSPLARKSSTRSPSPGKTTTTTKKERSSSSPLRTHRERSSSRRRGEAGEAADDETSKRRSHRSPSASSSKKRTEDSSNDAAATTSATKSSSRDRGRSGSRLRSRGKSLDSKEPRTSAIRESASHRSARERSRSRSKYDALGELKKATTRRSQRDGGANNNGSSALTDSTTPGLAAHMDAEEQSNRKAAEHGVVNDDASKSTQGSRSKKFDGNMSIGIDSIFSEGSSKSPGAAADAKTRLHHSTTADNMLKEGEESFQVISTAAGRSYTFGVGSRKGSKVKIPAITAEQGDVVTPSLKIVHGGQDKFENSKRRQSRTKVAEIQSERSSRKHNILSSLAREEDDDDEDIGPLVRMPNTPRSRESLPDCGGSGGGRTSQPNRTRSLAGVGNRSAPMMLDLTRSNSWHERDKKDDDGPADWAIETKNSDERRADFDKSFSIAELS